jgi:hypothetical protein
MHNILNFSNTELYWHNWDRESSSRNTAPAQLRFESVSVFFFESLIYLKLTEINSSYKYSPKT